MGLDSVRREIDRIDEEIVRLLNERARSAVRIGRMKKERGAAVRDPARENEILERLRELNKGPLSENAIIDIYRRSIDACLELEKNDC